LKNTHVHNDSEYQCECEFDCECDTDCECDIDMQLHVTVIAITFRQICTDFGVKLIK